MPVSAVRQPIIALTITASMAAVVLMTAVTKTPALPASPSICAAARKGHPQDGGYGTVHFENSCSRAVQVALAQEIAELHSFEADPKGFAAIGTRDPHCAIAWWGAAMSARGNPLGGVLDEGSLKLGRIYVNHALSIDRVTPREKGLISAMDVYYKPYSDQITRARAYAGAMDEVHAAYIDDPDVAAFDALAIIEGVDLNDKTYSRQRRAGAILERVTRSFPAHPGALHYLIHAYDYTALAPMAVHAATVYPTIATASSHANHMPAHIWSMLGRWDQSIEANRASEYLADSSSAHDRVRGDIVYEHAFDFIAYARLQKGQDAYVADDLKAATKTPSVIAARYFLERGDWVGASTLPVPNDDIFGEALARFTRAYGQARQGDVSAANIEIARLEALRQSVASSAGEYWGIFVDIYAKTARAWALKAAGRNEAALMLMREAAAQDDGHEKHIYLENKILPMRESLADMELALGFPSLSLNDYEASLKVAPNRYRSYFGALKASKKNGDSAAEIRWASQFQRLAKDQDQSRRLFSAKSDP